MTGQYIAATGLPAISPGEWVEVGSLGEGMPPPPKAQGVRASAGRDFGATFGRAIGFDEFTATAEATAVMGRLTGGTFLPLVLPVSPSECTNSGFLQPFDDPNKTSMWFMSNPGSSHPSGTEYVVPLCKTGGGSFMFLDLDPDLDCGEEVLRPPSIQFDTFPVDIDTDTGGDCQKKVADAIDAADLQGKVVLIPICDNDCITGSGSNAQYHVVRIAAFYVDFMSFDEQERRGLLAQQRRPPTARRWSRSCPATARTAASPAGSCATSRRARSGPWTCTTARRSGSS